MKSEGSSTPSPASIFSPPGGAFIWSIVLMELLTFGVALIAFVIAGRHEPEVFEAGRQQLQPLLGLTNTGLLLASGYCVAEAVVRFKRGVDARPFIQVAIFGGCLFLIVKGIEYSGKIQAGLNLSHDTFTTYYWLLTVFHMLHVVVGLVILGVLYRGLRPAAEPMKLEDLEAGAVFWHMCDLIWLILFPVIYLLP